MNITKPPLDARQSGRASDDVEADLRDFFRASMPDPWPACPTPLQSLLPMQRRSSWKQRARPALALAASLLLIALGAAFVSGKFSTGSSSPLNGDPPIGTRNPDNLPHGVPQKQ